MPCGRCKLYWMAKAAQWCRAEQKKADELKAKKSQAKPPSSLSRSDVLQFNPLMKELEDYRQQAIARAQEREETAHQAELVAATKYTAEEAETQKNGTEQYSNQSELMGSKANVEAWKKGEKQHVLMQPRFINCDNDDYNGSMQVTLTWD